MIVIMRVGGPPEEVERVQSLLARRGLQTHAFLGEERVVLTILGEAEDQENLAEILTRLPGVERVAPLRAPYKLASREGHPTSSLVHTAAGSFGDGGFSVLACLRDGSAADRQPLARQVAASGAVPVTGHAVEGSVLLAEPDDPAEVAILDSGRSILRLNAHDMQNSALLRAAGRSDCPVILERGLSARIDEWLMAAEFIMRTGNRQVILCERGIRTFESDRPSVLDVSAVPVLKHLTHLPVVVDPGRGSTQIDEVLPMALAAAAAGADGLLLDVASGDVVAAPHALPLADLPRLMAALRAVLTAVGRSLSAVPGVPSRD